jgi:hypothetical protein
VDDDELMIEGGEVEDVVMERESGCSDCVASIRGERRVPTQR